MEAIKSLHRYTASEVAHILGGKPGSNGWHNCPCPCTHNHKHGDKHPSLGLRDGEDGNLIPKCQTGCKPKEIYQALKDRGIPFYERELPAVFSVSRSAKKTVVAEYPYYSEDGDVLYTKIRYSDKTFGYDPIGMGDKFVLYNLPLIKLAREHGWTVYLCEGEKDADRIREFDLASTTSPDGASKPPAKVKWRESYTQALAGLDVVILEDNDEAGRNHSNGVAALLHGRANSVKIVSFPELPEKGDVFDYLQDHSKEEFLARVENTPMFVPLQEVKQFDLSERGNGHRFVHYVAGRVRYCRQLKEPWFCFNGKVWKQNELAAERLAKEVIKLIPLEAKFYPDEVSLKTSSAEDSKRKKKALDSFLSHIKASNRYASGVKNTLLEARSDLEIELSELDGNSVGLFNVNNGTIDLRTGELRPHCKDDLLTKICPYDYNPDASAVRWVQFMDEICQGNQLLVEYWQCLLGYMLTGEANLRLFIVLYGAGRNGKSTLVETISRIVGDDYSAGLPTTTIYARKFDDQVTTPELARLRGARFVYASEGEEKKKLAVGMVKRLSGDEKITVRPLNKENFDLLPMFTIFFSTNHRPEISDTTDSIWDRLKLIPFNRRFEDHEIDPNLKRTFLQESAGILAWMVQGAVKYYQNGCKLPVCDAVTAGTAEYRADADLAGRFLTECCELGAGKEIQCKKLYEGFRKWCSDNGIPEVASSEAFSKRLRERGLRNEPRTGKRYFWQGIDLIESEDNLLSRGWD